ncbi:MAG: ZIP family metal transporter [Eubacteriaceae bacterium]
MLSFYFGILICSLMMLVGGGLHWVIKRRKKRNVDLLQGFSAGMLLAIIFVGIIPEALHELQGVFSQNYHFFLVGSMGLGALILPGFEKILPVQHHHDFINDRDEQKSKRDLLVLLAAFGIHSTFELFAILVTGESNPLFGWSLVVVIGLHNIPIGFIIFSQLEKFEYETKKTFMFVAILGIVQWVFSLLLYFLFLPYLGGRLTGVLLGITSGILLYLTFDELLPQIYKENKQHSVNASIIVGILAMTFIILLEIH